MSNRKSDEEVVKRLHNICVFLFVIVNYSRNFTPTIRAKIEETMWKIDPDKLFSIINGTSVDDDTMFDTLECFSSLKQMDGFVIEAFQCRPLVNTLDKMGVEFNTVCK
jgi:hypothetical protein